MSPYVPDRGDVIWIRLVAPTNTTESTGQSPVLVVSPRSYNEATGLLLACPVTSQIKDYPFEVAIAGDFMSGVVLADQISTLDWRSRKPKIIFKTAPETLAAVVSNLNLLLG